MVNRDHLELDLPLPLQSVYYATNVLSLILPMKKGIPDKILL